MPKRILPVTAIFPALLLLPQPLSLWHLNELYVTKSHLDRLHLLDKQQAGLWNAEFIFLLTRNHPEADDAEDETPGLVLGWNLPEQTKAQSWPQEPVSCSRYLGKLSSVGTWQVRWNTFGHFSQHKRSPPFWQTAHQSSLGSSSLLVPSPPILADRCIRLRTGDLPFTRLCPDCLQLSLKSAGSVFTWFSRLPNASNSLSRCKLVDSGGVKLLSGLLSWKESSTWKSESVLQGHPPSHVGCQKPSNT